MEPSRKPRPAGAGAKSSGRLAGTRILVVDDTPDSRELIARILVRTGATVRTADGAEAALEAIAEEPFDVVLSDIGMPGTDGFALLARMRARSPGATAPGVIAVTGYASEDFRERCLAAGFREHLPKPIELELLLRTIESTRDGVVASRRAARPDDGSRAAQS